MSDIFVSYSRKDRDVVKRLVEVMKGRGWSVWWDPTIRPGEYYEDVIESALTSSKCVIVVWSKNSVASKWVRAEAAEAANRGVLVPVVIDDAKIPFRFKQIQEAQLADWRFTADHPELVRLLDSIAETFLKAQDAPNRTSVSSARETEAKKAETAAPGPPISEFQSDHDARASQPPPSPIDDDLALDDSAPRIEPEAFPSEKAQPPRPTPVQSGAADDFTTGEQTRPQLKSTSRLVIPLLIILGLAAVGAIYIFAFRESAGTDNGNQAEIARQDGPANEQPNVNGVTTVTPTPSVTPSPGVTPTETPALNRANAVKLAGLLKGKWQSQTASGNCECSTSACFDIQFSKTIPDFCVESNQVYVSAQFKLDAANNKAYLFFKEPGDLGAGGNKMPWDKFDRTKPLATIDLSDLEAQRVLYVTWHGFTETGAARQRWRQIGSGYQGTYLKR